jgi:cell division protein FtsQ
LKTAALALRSVPRAALSLPPAWRRRLAAVLASLIVLGAGYWFWFRDSSFARVHDVYVTGVSGPQARAIRARLEDAGLDMSTLHVNPADLRAAVADYPVVRSITAQGAFPHTLTVQVDLNLPVAILDTPTGRKPVAADGLLLSEVPITSNLPVLKTKVALPSERVTGGAAFALVRVISLAPEPLSARVKSVGFRPGIGIVAQLVKGPELRFGDSTRIPAKWLAAARVLAAAGARGATYIDLRLPERPAAGGLPTTTVIPLAPAGAPTPTTTQAAPTPTTTTPSATTTTTTTTPAQTAPATTQTATTPAPTQTVPPATSGGATAAPQNPQPQVQTQP